MLVVLYLVAAALLLRSAVALLLSPVMVVLHRSVVELPKVARE